MILALEKLKIHPQLINCLLPDVFTGSGGLDGSPFFINKGWSQGSCLDLFLRLALLETILQDFHVDGCAVVSYADDILFIIWAPMSHFSLHIIQNWATNNKTEISQEKSKSMIFGKPKHVKRGPIYKVQGKNLNQKKNYA